MPGQSPNGISAALLLLVSVSFMPTASARQKYDESKVEYIDNGAIRLGVSMDLGGAITYIADSKAGKNIINNWDWGRQIQMSFFAFPAPYIEKGQKPKKHWVTSRKKHCFPRHARRRLHITTAVLVCRQGIQDLGAA